MKYVIFAISAALVLTDQSFALAQAADDIYDRVTHGYANSSGVKIHFHPRAGSANCHGPRISRLLVLVRHQMAVLSKDYQVVAIDQRGYNLSDKPKGQEQYDLRLLVDDLSIDVLNGVPQV